MVRCLAPVKVWRGRGQEGGGSNNRWNEMVAVVKGGKRWQW